MQQKAWQSELKWVVWWRAAVPTEVQVLPEAKRIVLNGRFLVQSMTGVQRYATEMITALDRLIEAGDVPARLADAEWVVLRPAGPAADLALRRIPVRVAGGPVNAQIWDQAVLPFAARGSTLVSLANSGPVMHRRHLVVIHDAIVFRHPEFYGRSYVSFHKTLGRLLAWTATIGTVSDFSRNELASLLGLKAGSIPVLANGADHLSRVVPDDSVLDELDLRGRSFFLALGSLSGNKNVQVAAEAFARLNRPDARLVLVGSGSAIFRSNTVETVSGLLRPGRLSDEKIASLYANAVAFVFPSIYEGFGIPPLEAMAFGSPVLASRAGAVVETCADAASYFDAHDTETLAGLMRDRLDDGRPSQGIQDRQRRHAARFTWESSARRLLEAISQI